MAKIINLSYFNYDEDILIISDTCALHRGEIIYKTEFDRIRAKEIADRKTEIQFDFDNFLTMQGNLFIDYNCENFHQLNICFNAKQLRFIKENPKYVKLAIKVSSVLQEPINNSRYYFRLDISKDYTEYYNMIINNYKQVSVAEFNEYKNAIYYIEHKMMHYKYKDVVSFKYTDNFNVIGFRPIAKDYLQHVIPLNITDNINANILKTIGLLDRFIETVQYWRLKDA